MHAPFEAAGAVSERGSVAAWSKRNPQNASGISSNLSLSLFRCFVVSFIASNIPLLVLMESKAGERESYEGDSEGEISKKRGVLYFDFGHCVECLALVAHQSVRC